MSHLLSVNVVLNSRFRGFQIIWLPAKQRQYNRDNLVAKDTDWRILGRHVSNINTHLSTSVTMERAWAVTDCSSHWPFLKRKDEFPSKKLPNGTFTHYIKWYLAIKYTHICTTALYSSIIGRYTQSIGSRSWPTKPVCKVSICPKLCKCRFLK